MSVEIKHTIARLTNVTPRRHVEKIREYRAIANAAEAEGKDVMDRLQDEEYLELGRITFGAMGGVFLPILGIQNLIQGFERGDPIRVIAGAFEIFVASLSARAAVRGVDNSIAIGSVISKPQPSWFKRK